MPEQLPEIELEDRGSKGRYVLRGPDGAEAEMTFTKIGEHQIIIDHTEVPDVFRGQGAGPGDPLNGGVSRDQAQKRRIMNLESRLQSVDSPPDS